MAWEDASGFHALLPGTPPDPTALAHMENEMRRIIRSSPEWAEIVREHGVEGAEALLQQIKGRLGP
jgi:hypothetical protein